MFIGTFKYSVCVLCTKMVEKLTIKCAVFAYVYYPPYMKYKIYIYYIIFIFPLFLYACIFLYVYYPPYICNI